MRVSFDLNVGNKNIAAQFSTAPMPTPHDPHAAWPPVFFSNRHQGQCPKSSSAQQASGAATFQGCPLSRAETARCGTGRQCYALHMGHAGQGVAQAARVTARGVPTSPLTAGHRDAAFHRLLELSLKLYEGPLGLRPLQVGEEQRPPPERMSRAASTLRGCPSAHLGACTKFPLGAHS